MLFIRRKNFDKCKKALTNLLAGNTLFEMIYKCVLKQYLNTIPILYIGEYEMG